jgi:hypothetical protein
MSLVVLLVLLLVVVVVGGSLALGIRAVRTGGQSRTPDERRNAREAEALERRYQQEHGDLPPTHEQL